ncbi:MAG: hypothetical protein R3183_00625 [Oleiphilaceae bacterium]|nr:hypothetical protein [Oleiphilaceae bacterium]
MATIKTYQEQVKEIVEKAINAVEEQHKALASASFTYAEKLYKLDSVKSKHDEVAGIAYEKARDVNNKVASFAADLIAKFEKEEGKVKSTAKKASTTAKKKATSAKKAAKSVADKAEAATEAATA